MLESNNLYNWWKNIDKIILLIISLLFILGLFFSFVSTSFIASDKLETNSYFFFIKHLIFVLIGSLILFIFSYLNKKTLIQTSILFFIIFFIFLILVPFVGVEIKGSKRWIDIGSSLPRFQPIELLKPFFIVLVSYFLLINKNKNIYSNYLLNSILVIPTIFLLIAQPDIGQTTLISMIWLTVIFVSGVNLVIFFSFFAFFGLVISFLIIYIPKFIYIKKRILSFFDPSTGNNYQSERALDAIINGGFFGRGMGEGKLNSIIPEAHTDYIVSVISEEFGAIAIILIMVLFLIFAYQVIKKMNAEKDEIFKLILIGSVTLILLQTFIHIGVNIRLLPTTGMTLPFLSYGGSSIISTSILSGIILNITKRKVNQL